MSVGNRSSAAADATMSNERRAMNFMPDAASRSKGAQPGTDASWRPAPSFRRSHDKHLRPRLPAKTHGSPWSHRTHRGSVHLRLLLAERHGSAGRRDVPQAERADLLP